MANPSAEAYEAAMAEELKNEAETVLERGLKSVTGSEQDPWFPGRRRECELPIDLAVSSALGSDAVMAKLLAVLKKGTPEETVKRVNALAVAIAKQIGNDNALGVVEGRFAPLLAAMEEGS